MPTAIEIFKLLPKKNCGKCNYPTCLAFAMHIANSKAKLEDCPFISEEAKASLAASAAPPIRLVKIGHGARVFEMGDETELYRHEKKFFHAIGYALTISDSSTPEEMRGRLGRIETLSYERVGQKLGIDLIALRNDSLDPSRFAEAAKALSDLTDRPIVLLSDSAASMRSAAASVAAKRPLLCGAVKDSLADFVAIAKETGCPLAIRGKELNELADMVTKARAGGVEDLVLDLEVANLKELVEKATIIRRHAVKKSFRGLGYPILVRAGTGEGAVLKGMLATMKYGSLVIFEDLKDSEAMPLFVLRQNIFTDPQVPIQVKPGLYPVNNPGEQAPILFTTNFSLTYFTVIADVEKSKMPAWLQVVDTEGLSVLTAYSAGKLTPEIVAKALEDSGANARSRSGRLIIPGMVTRMSGKLQEVTGMKVIVGPKESSGLPKFLKNL